MIYCNKMINNYDKNGQCYMEIIPIIKMTKLIRQRNDLTDACCTLTIQEKRVLYLLKWKISRTLEASKSPIVTITIDDYAKHFELTNDRAGKDLRAAIKNLYDLELRFKSDDTKNRWLVGIPENLTTGTYKVELSPRVFKHLVFPEDEKLGAFTRLFLEDAAVTKNVYAVKLLAVFRRWEYQHGAVFNIEDLYEYFDVPACYQVSFSKAMRFVFKPAIKEIEDLGLYSCKIIPNKVGRKITQVMFQMVNLQIGKDK